MLSHSGHLSDPCSQCREVCAYNARLSSLGLVPFSMRGRALPHLLALVSLAVGIEGEIFPLKITSVVGADAFCTAQEEVQAIAPRAHFALHHHKACACISANMLGAEGANSQLQVQPPDIKSHALDLQQQICELAFLSAPYPIVATATQNPHTSFQCWLMLCG